MEFEDGSHRVLPNGTYFKKWCSTTLLSFKSIGESIFDVESGNQNVDGQMDGCQTNQSARQVGYMAPAQ